MKLSLEPLRVAGLTNMEAGQLIIRHLTDLETTDAVLKTDEPYNSYIQTLTGQSVLYEKALAQIRKSEETLKIAAADDSRDKSIKAFDLCLKTYAVSDDETEVEAARGLRIIFGNFKQLAAMNYEAETMAIDKLTGELDKPAAAAKVATLGIERYVTRLKSTNETFKALFSLRMQTEAADDGYDMKAIRKETYQTYAEFCNYVLAMARALKTPLFTGSLSLINTARSYYADLLARRNGKEKEQEEAIV